MTKINYSKLSAVAWVSPSLVMGLLIAITVANITSAVWNSEDAFWAIFACLLLIMAFMSYPYYHYRREGGYVKRMPPRFVLDKPVFEKAR